MTDRKHWWLWLLVVGCGHEHEHEHEKQSSSFIHKTDYTLDFVVMMAMAWHGMAC